MVVVSILLGVRLVQLRCSLLNKKKTFECTLSENNVSETYYTFKTIWHSLSGLKVAGFDVGLVHKGSKTRRFNGQAEAGSIQQRKRERSRTFLKAHCVSNITLNMFAE